MSRPTVAEIDLSALENNWNLFKELQNSEKIIPVIKANAYGHGDVIIAKKLQELGALQCAVAMVDEAQKVRESNFNGNILTLGPFTRKEISVYKKDKITPIIVNKENLVDLIAENFDGVAHIKWDTGMNRLGLKYSDSNWLNDTLKKQTQLKIQAFCTHFLKSSDFKDDLGYCSYQIKEFQKIESLFPQIKDKHIFNTDSFFSNGEIKRLPDSYGARIGLGLYGYSDINNLWTQRLRPVLKLKTKIVHITKVQKGQSVSYNASWVAQQDSVIATLPIGYADGYPRSLSNKGHVFLKGQRVPLVGIVCMDYIMIDITKAGNIGIGEEVELWGENLPLKTLADLAGTIVYELLTSLSVRVPRIAING